MRRASPASSRWRSALALAAASVALGLPAIADPPGEVLDLEGRAADPLADTAASAIVLVFTGTECPISNRYAPELRRLRDRFAGRGVAFWLVYPDPQESPDAVRRHRRAFGVGIDVVRDPRHALVRLAGATITPEVAVFVGGGGGRARLRMLYRGRIDDRAVEFGRTRAAPTRRDLAEVLESVAAGRMVVPRTTTAVGCFIPALP